MTRRLEEITRALIEKEILKEDQQSTERGDVSFRCSMRKKLLFFPGDRVTGPRGKTIGRIKSRGK